MSSDSDKQSFPVGRTLGIAILTWLFFVFSMTEARLQHFFNSDNAYPQVFVQDIWQQPGTILGWHLPGAPFFFPDIAMQFAAWLLSGNYHASLYLVSFFQLAVFCVLAGSLLSHSHRLAQLALLILPLAYEISGLNHGSSIAFRTIVFPAFHGGALLTALLGLALISSLLASPSWTKRILLASVIALGTVSDRMLLTIFCIPTLIVAYWFAMSSPLGRGTWRELALNILAGTLLGLGGFYLLGSLFTIAPLPRSQTWSQALLPSATALWTDLLHNQHLLLVLVCSVPLAVSKLWFHFRRSSARHSSRSLVEMSLALGQLAHLGAVVLLAIYQPGSERYLGIAGWLGFILMVMSLRALFNRMVFSSLAIGYTVCLVSTHYDLSLAHLTYYPALVRCLDSHARDFSLSVGISDYWFAKFATTLSRAGLEVLQVNAKGNADFQLHNSAHYIEPVSGMPRKINFILMGRLKDQAIRKRYGKPDKILRCSRMPVWIYGQSQPVHLSTHFRKQKPRS